MKKAILGKKVGMTQIFDKNGRAIPVTVVEAGPCTVVQVKTKDADGYEAIQLGFGEVKEKKLIKPTKGHFTKANVTPKKHLREFRLEEISYNVGDEIKADIFTAGESVDVTGTSKGKGFQGVIKRHNQSCGPMGHGSQYHRGVGSLGTMLPMHVLKGKKMPGQMGNVKRTVQNLEIVSIDKENNLILIKGNVPGSKQSLVIIRTAVKMPGASKTPADLVSYVEEVEVSEENAENVENTEVLETAE